MGVRAVTCEVKFDRDGRQSRDGELGESGEGDFVRGDELGSGKRINSAHLPGLVAREAVLSERAKVAELGEAYRHAASDRLGRLEHNLRDGAVGKSARVILGSALDRGVTPRGAGLRSGFTHV